MSSTVTITHPATGRVYEVYFKGDRPEAVARQLPGRIRFVDVWWRLKGPPSPPVLKIIALAEAERLTSSSTIPISGL
jgi:hypothetical protein